MLSTVVLSNENQTCRGWEAHTSTGGGGCHKLSAEEQTEKMQLVMQEVQKISSYTGVSEDAAYKLFLNGYSVPNELAGQQIAFSEDELTVDLLNSLAENKVRSIKIIPEEESLATGYMDYLHKQKKDNKF